VEAIADWCRDQALPEYELGVVTEVEDDAAAADEASDELFPQAVRVVIESGQASVSLVQRRLRVGYARAGRLIDMMEEKGYIGRHEGSKPRDVLITMDQYRRAFGEERDN
jgi:S-DNA-T family DNA segregation ATPase FtsK/SpoIIIE